MRSAHAMVSASSSAPGAVGLRDGQADGWTDARPGVRPMAEDPPDGGRVSLAREVLRTMRRRNLLTGLFIPITVAISVGIAVVVAAGANNGAGSTAPSQLAAGFPPARIATADFTSTPALAGRGIAATLTQVASLGSDIVAVGAQAGGHISRVRFLFSGDNGRTWRLAPVQAAGGTAPPPGQGPVMVAAGPGGWVAVAPNASYTSPNGQAWTAHPVLPLQPGDGVAALVAAGTGFVAAGQNSPGSNSPGSNPTGTPVVWLSANGASWRRLSGAQLSLPAPAGTRVTGLTHAAANGPVIVATGALSSGESAAWRSADGGVTWTPVTIPADAGAALTISGLAPLRGGFLAVRTARVNGSTGALVYTSPDGATWTRSAAITTADGAALTIGQVSGGPGGAVIEGSADGFLIAFLSANGATWTGTNPFGTAATGLAEGEPVGEQVGGVALTTAGQAIIAGTTGTTGTTGTSGTENTAGVAAGSQPALTLIGATGGPQQVAVAAIAGFSQPEVTVNAIATLNATQLAAGSADGSPAVWESADGGSTWARATGAGLQRTGLQQLTAVAHGTAGWVAVGGPDEAGTPVPGHPVVVGSPDGRTWSAADGARAFAAPGLVTSAVAASPGRAGGYVIVGWQATGAHTTGMAWFSAGLAGWQPALLPTAGGDTRVLAVTAAGGGFVAVGSAGARPAAWVSPNGTAWHQVTLALPDSAVTASLSLVAANGGTVAAAGTAITSSGQQAPFAAISANGGSTWQEEALPAPSRAATGTTAATGATDLAVTALTAAGGGFTATGTFGAPGSQDVVIWTRAPAEGGNTASGTWMAAAPEGYGLSGQGVQSISALAVAGSTLTGAGFNATQAAEVPTIWQSPIRS
jgi:hypothetical protein